MLLTQHLDPYKLYVAAFPTQRGERSCLQILLREKIITGNVYEDFLPQFWEQIKNELPPEVLAVNNCRVSLPNLWKASLFLAPENVDFSIDKFLPNQRVQMLTVQGTEIEYSLSDG